MPNTPMILLVPIRITRQVSGDSRGELQSAGADWDEPHHFRLRRFFYGTKSS